MMNNGQSNTEHIVMRRVHRIAFLRPFISIQALSIALALAALYGIGREVWVARVFENAPRDLAALPQFYLAAFTHTELVVQALTVIAVVSLFYLARTLARTLAAPLLPLRA